MYAKTSFSARKIASVVIIATIIMMLFSGCRAKCVEGSNAYPECLGDANPNRVIPTITLEFWNLDDDPDIFRGAIQRFEKKQWNDFSVKINYKSFTNKENYEEYLMNKMAEGDGPDIFAMDQSWLPKHLKKISPMPESIGMTPEMLREKMQSVAANAVIWQDPVAKVERIYALPLYVDTLALYYNKNLFSKLNPDDTKKPRETWEKIKIQTVQLKEENQNSAEGYVYTGIAMGREDNIRHAVDILSMLFLQYGVPLVSSDYTKIDLGNANTALKEYKSFEHGAAEIQGNWNQLITAYYPEEKDLGAFVRNKVGMIFGYASTYDDIVKLIEKHEKDRDQNTITENDIGIIEAPQIKSRDERKEGEFEIYLADLNVLTVSAMSDANKQQLAWQFLLEIATDEENFLKEYFEKTRKPTALVGNLNDVQKKDKTFGVFAQQVQYSKTLPYLDKNDYWRIFSEAIKKENREGSSSVLEKAAVRLKCVLEIITDKSKTPDTECTEME